MSLSKIKALKDLVSEGSDAEAVLEGLELLARMIIRLEDEVTKIKRDVENVQMLVRR